MKGKLVLLIAIMVFAGEVLAAEFAVVGARALGMGGAHVAVVDDATAVYWNPAAIAGNSGRKFSFPVGVQVVERNDIVDKLSDIEDVLEGYDLTDSEIFLDPIKVDELTELFRKLGESGTGIGGNGHIGLLASRDNIAFGVIDLAYFGGWVTTDLVNIETGAPGLPSSIANNESSVSVLGLESREFGVTYAAEFKEILVGGNIKYISGRSYYKSVSIEDPDLEGGLEEETSSDFGLDVGLLYNFPEGKWKTGLVLRNINSPSFSYEDGEVELELQARGGVAYQVSEDLIIACDLDITENESMTLGHDERTLALGVERRALAGTVALRGGIYKNIAESSADPVLTVGLGFGVPMVKFDLGLGVNPGLEELALHFALSSVF